MDLAFVEGLHSLQKDFQSLLNRIAESTDMEEEETLLDQARIVLAK